MDINALEGARHRQAATHGDPMSDSEMQEDAQSLWKELQGLTHDRLRLAALETQRAAERLVTMIVMGVMVRLKSKALESQIASNRVSSLIKNTQERMPLQSMLQE
jgi:hypothetical protein